MRRRSRSEPSIREMSAPYANKRREYDGSPWLGCRYSGPRRGTFYAQVAPKFRACVISLRTVLRLGRPRSIEVCAPSHRLQLRVGGGEDSAAADAGCAGASRLLDRGREDAAGTEVPESVWFRISSVPVGLSADTVTAASSMNVACSRWSIGMRSSDADRR